MPFVFPSSHIILRFRHSFIPGPCTHSWPGRYALWLGILLFSPAISIRLSVCTSTCSPVDHRYGLMIVMHITYCPPPLFVLIYCSSYIHWVWLLPRIYHSCSILVSFNHAFIFIIGSCALQSQSLSQWQSLSQYSWVGIAVFRYIGSNVCCHKLPILPLSFFFSSSIFNLALNVYISLFVRIGEINRNKEMEKESWR